MKLNNVINFILSMIFLVSKCCTDYIFNWLLIIISYVSPFASVPPTPHKTYSSSYILHVSKCSNNEIVIEGMVLETSKLHP